MVILAYFGPWKLNVALMGELIGSREDVRG
jgi:hypothetical protein